MAKIPRVKREEFVTSLLSWFDFSLKLCGVNLIGGFEAKLNFLGLSFGWS